MIYSVSCQKSLLITFNDFNNMAITVFGATYSTRTHRVLLVLEELGLRYEFKHVDLMKGEHHVRLQTHALF